jgi:hypothetical protein
MMRTTRHGALRRTSRVTAIPATTGRSAIMADLTVRHGIPTREYLTQYTLVYRQDQPPMLDALKRGG